MEPQQQHNSLLEEVQSSLGQLSDERSRLAREFIAYLEQQDRDDRDRRRQQFLATDAAIAGLREQIRARTGIHPNSVPLIRQLREGDEYRG
ncbi:MAG: hypothetical protein GDA43_09735 [Hormoscilla sp. SP5CHS1]|nr:hypothetical protein [Hormoscilla sp. SP12CHS1]MBC6453459.1 hypothetical protein [Hormoscilla sp. SP5CHS1]